MATRVGIELSPLSCRIVEVEVASAHRAAAGETVVRSFEAMPLESLEARAKLASLKKRPVFVVVWGALSDHRVLTVTHGRHARMREEAAGQFARSMPDVQIDLRRVLAEIAPVGPKVEGETSRPVLLAAAAADGVREALRPLAAAGVRVQSVVTPALALQSLAWTRRAAAAPDAVDAYVALDETAACTALLRDGVLQVARDLPWGYLEERKGRMQARPRQEIAGRLADDLRELFRAAGGPVTQVSVCGGLPDLRSTMLSLTERLDIEVETLDSLFGIDPLRMPEPADMFRDRVSELRLVWAVAVDDRAPINLLRPQQQRAVRTTISRAAAVVGVAAGLGAAWAVEGGTVWRPTSAMPGTVARAIRPLGGPPPASARSVVPVASSLGEKPSVAPMPPMRSAAVPRELARMPPMEERAPAVSRRGGNVAPAPTRVRGALAPVSIDGAVDTILVGPDRRLAIVDGRIVQPGDDVRGARVVAITPTAVLLVDITGQTRRLTLNGWNQSKFP